MPHSLGHGIGLRHELPFSAARFWRNGSWNRGWYLLWSRGYGRGTGGVRLENDILITETGHKVLTKSRILYG